MKRKLIIWFIGFGIIVTGINVGITKLLLSQQRQAVVQLLGTHQDIMVLNAPEYLARMEADGLNRAEQLAHLENVTAALRAQGRLVLREQAVLSMSETSLIPYVEPSIVHDILEQHGLPKATAEEFKQHLLSAEQWLQQQMGAM